MSRCALAYYRKSASYEHALYLTGEPTPVISGVDQETFDQIVDTGIGSSSPWALGENPQAKAYFLSLDTDLNALERALDRELEMAESHAVKLTQTDSPESGKALQIKAAAQHASIYSMADSVSSGITKAQKMLESWGGVKGLDNFSLRTEFDQHIAGEAMITALNNAINSFNAPRSAMFETVRRMGLSEADNDEMQTEIDTQTSGLGQLDG